MRIPKTEREARKGDRSLMLTPEQQAELTDVIDVQVSNEGSLFLFTPLTTAAREWINENVTGETTWFGNALVVEHRYAGDLAQGMAGDGLEVR